MGLTGNLPRKRKKTASTPAVNVRSTQKKAGKKRKSESMRRVAVGQQASNGRRVEHASAVAGPPDLPTVLFDAIDNLEADIDRLIFKVMALGGSSAIEDALRQARRLLYTAFSKTPF